MSGPDVQNPYVGLRPFFRADSLYFFGRREQVAELLENLHGVHFLGVVGSSGCGKSSLIRAGLIPALLGGFLVEERDNWRIGVMKPGDAPLHNLATALCQDEEGNADPFEVNALRKAISENHTEAIFDFLGKRLGSDTNQLLLIDQFEEIFAYGRPSRALRTAEPSAEERRKQSLRRAEAADFVDIVVRLAEKRTLPVYTVLTMRTDFLGDCDLFYGLPEAMNQGRYLVPRLTRQQLREAIQGPALLARAELAPRFLDSLLNTLGDRGDRLPVLQHALLRTWHNWEAQGKKAKIDLEHFEAAGRLENALSLHAEEALNEEALEPTERIFKCLTDTDANRRQIRRPTNLSELVAVSGADREAVEKILQSFISGGRHFIVLSQGADPEDPRVDISHESLIRRWPRLTRWVEEERISSERFTDLVKRARREEAGQGPLLVEEDLQSGLDWRKSAHPTQAWAQRYSVKEDDFESAMSFLERSRLAAEAAERRRRRNRNILVAAATIAFLVVSGLTAWALREKAKGRDIARVATGSALMATDPTRSALVLLEVKKPEREWHGWSPTQKMVQVLGYGFFDSEMDGHTGPVRSLEFDTGGRRLLTASDDGTARIWDVESGRALAVFDAGGRVTSAAFAPGGDRIVTAYCVSAKAGEEPRSKQECLSHGARIWIVDATTLSHDETPAEWSQRSSRAEGPAIAGHEKPIERVVFGPAGRRVLTASQDGTVKIWDAETGEQLFSEITHDGPVNWAAFNPEGTRIVTASDDQTARIWSLDPDDPAVAPREVATLSGHTAEVKYAEFSPDSTRVVTASRDNTARIWWADGAGELAVLEGHGKTIRVATFNRDGDLVLTASRDGTARVWRADGPSDGPLVDFSGHEGPLVAASFNQVGDRVVTAAEDGSAQVWSVDGSDLHDPLILRKTGIRAAAFSPNGRKVATAAEDGRVHLWSARSPGSAQDLMAPTGSARAASFHPDGSLVVTALRDGTARIWEANGARELFSLPGTGRELNWAGFSPDGRRVVTASIDGTARVWDWARPAAPIVLRGHDSAIGSALFSPDGQRVVTASIDRTARVWDVETGGTAADNTAADNTVAVLVGHDAPVRWAAFSPDGERVVTASFDGTSRIWSVDTSAELMRLEGHAGRVSMASFDPDGTRVVTGSGDGTVRLWNAETGVEITALEGDGTGVVFVGFSADGKSVISLSEGGTRRTWDSDSSRMKTEELPSGELVAGAFSPDGTALLTVHRDGRAVVAEIAESGVRSPVVVAGPDGGALAASFLDGGRRVVTFTAYGLRIWDRPDATGPLGFDRQAYLGRTGEITSAAFNDQGTRVAAVRESGTVHIWSVEDPQAEPVVLAGPSTTASRVVFDPAGEQLAVATTDGTVRIWSTDGESGPVVLSEHLERVNSVVFDPSGGRVVTSSDDGTARVWDARSGKRISLLEAVDSRCERGAGMSGEGSERVEWADFSPDGSTVATASEDGNARLWDAETGRELACLEGHGEGADLEDKGIELTRFSPDGKFVLTASEDGTARVWPTEEARDPEAIRVLEGHRDHVTFGAFSPDGKRVVTTSRDGTARVWKVDSKEDPVLLKGHRTPVISGAFSPDGKSVITVTEGGTARFWELSGKALQQAIDQTVEFCLEEKFREESLGEAPGEAKRRYDECRLARDEREG